MRPDVRPRDTQLGELIGVAEAWVPERGEAWAPDKLVRTPPRPDERDHPHQGCIDELEKGMPKGPEDWRLGHFA